MTNSQTSSTPRISYPFAKLDRGDVVWATVGYQNDIENDERTIVGRRPCVIVSTKRYHKNFGTVIAVPISHSNHFPKVDVELTSVPELDGYRTTKKTSTFVVEVTLILVKLAMQNSVRF